MPGRGNSVGQEVKESLVHLKPEWDLMGWCGEGRQGQLLEGWSWIKGLEFCPKSKGDLLKEEGERRWYDHAWDLHLRMIALVWEQDWRRCDRRWGEGHRHSWTFSLWWPKNSPGPPSAPTRQWHFWKSCLSLFGGCDVLSWCTLPPSPRAPLSRTTDNLMEMLLQNLHQEICSSLVQLPLPALYFRKQKFRGNKNLGTQVMIEPDRWSHCPNHSRVWGCLLLWWSPGQWSQHPGAGTSPAIRPPPTGYSWENPSSVPCELCDLGEVYILSGASLVAQQ